MKKIKLNFYDSSKFLYCSNYNSSEWELDVRIGLPSDVCMIDGEYKKIEFSDDKFIIKGGELR